MDEDAEPRPGAGEFKSELTKKALVRTEKLAKLAPDQVCDEELIPVNRADIKASQQIDWAVDIGKGGIYPFKTGIFAHTISIRYGAKIGGALVAGRNIDKVEGRITIESGTAKTPCQILGSVTCDGLVEIVEPKARLEDYRPSPAFIFGDIIAHKIIIKTPAIVYGNLLASSGIDIDHPLSKTCFSRIYGIIRSAAGAIFLRNTIAGGVIGGGTQPRVAAGAKPEETKIVLKEGVTLIHPQIIVRDGAIKLQQPTRYIDIPCTQCGHFQAGPGADQLFLNCTLFCRGACDDYSRITSEDIFHNSLSDGKGIEYTEPGWRAVKEMDEALNARIRFFLRQFEERTAERDLDSLVYSGTGSLRDPVSTVNNIIQYIDQSMKIQDSIINRSSIGTSSGLITQIDDSVTVRDRSLNLGQ